MKKSINITPDIIRFNEEQTFEFKGKSYSIKGRFLEKILDAWDNKQYKETPSWLDQGRYSFTCLGSVRKTEAIIKAIETIKQS